MLVGTPASRPAALLDFASGSIDPRLTFSRASTATRTNRAGSIETVAAGIPRIDHDPLTGAVRGVLIEPQSTNLLKYSSVLSNAAWSRNRASAAISEAYTPMGTLSYKLVEDATSGAHYIYQTVTPAVGRAYTLSVYVKPGERSEAGLKYFSSGIGVSSAFFSAQDGSIIYASGCTAKAEQLKDGWYRFSITFTVLEAVSARVAIIIGTPNYYAGDGVSSMYFCGAQFEMLSSASSLIETTSAQVTRAADSLSLQSSAFSRVIAESQGTLYAEVMHNCAAWPAPTPAALCLSDGTGTGETSGIVVSLSASGTALDVTSGGVSQASLSSSSGSAAGIHRIAVAYKNARFALSADGLSVASKLSGTAPAITRLDIGSTIGARHFDGWIRRVAVFPRGFDDVILQNMSI